MDWSLIGQADRVQCLPVPAVAVTAHATAHTKGSWVELVSSVPFPASLSLLVCWTNTSYQDFLIDIAIGDPGSEQIIAPNLLSPSGPGMDAFYVSLSYDLGITVSAGSRISARTQCSSGGKFLNFQILLTGIGGWGGVVPLALVEAFGCNTGTTRGTSIDPGGTIDTKGSYFEISASLPNAIRGIFFAIGGQRNTARSDCIWYVDIAIGEAGFEHVIIADHSISASAMIDTITPKCSAFFPISIPAGSRIAVRARCNITDATDRLFDIVIYGVR